MGFSNRDRLRRKMKAIPGAVRKAAREQLKKNAEELVETQKGFAPVDEGALKASIKQRDVSDSTRISRRVSAGGRSAPYAAWVEFGTGSSDGVAPRQNKNYRRTVVMTKGKRAHGATDPRPFFWPAYRLKRRLFKGRMTRAARKAIKEAIK
jgi:HK97 gp10 family phage protein